MAASATSLRGAGSGFFMVQTPSCDRAGTEANSVPRNATAISGRPRMNMAILPKQKFEALPPSDQTLQFTHNDMGNYGHPCLAVVEAWNGREILAAVGPENIRVLDRDLLQRL